jgi:phosphoglycolate phosphatase-like HAD superfamily hydrolase
VTRRRLVLFDIDGTLVSAGGVSGRALVATLRETFGTAGAADDYDYSGKTDPQIVRELMRGAGFADDAIEERLPGTLAQYRERLLGWLRPEDVTPKPGIAALLEALAAHPRATLGLLTGNLEPCARAKLAPVGANPYFPFGAYGSDHADRYQLPAIGLARGRAAAGVAFEGSDVVIVGDSVHDVLCGRSLGVRAVAVATGRTTPQQLAAVAPEALLGDFTDTMAAVRAILGDSEFNKR